MKLRFLCPERRRWLMQDIDAAAYTQQQLQDIAARALSSGDTPSAIRLAGSSLECAELLLLTHREANTGTVAAFQASSELLSRALEASGSRKLACQVVGGSIATLQGINADSETVENIRLACLTLLSTLHDGHRQSRTHLTGHRQGRSRGASQ